MDRPNSQDITGSDRHETVDENDDIDNLPGNNKRQRSLPSDSGIIPSLDGAADRWGKRRKLPVSAIFIHAGAGYHSANNEHIHLAACSEAARLSIKLLRSGHSAIDAVEAAIKVLEDKEITNAGYGSNLSIDGTVECDATLVDHLGRSGACGAVPNIKNPITLAKVILECSSRPLSLRRVPPNLLIGDGAKEFAHESGMGLIPNEYLVSRNARDRYVRWQEDLRRAEGKESSTLETSGYDQIVVSTLNAEPCHRDHTNAILTGTWNEGQPDSPVSPSPWESGPHSHTNSPVPIRVGISPQTSPGTLVDRNPFNFLGSALSSSKNSAAKVASPTPKRPRFVSGPSNESLKSNSSTSTPNNTTGAAYHDGAGSDASSVPFSYTSKNALNTIVPQIKVDKPSRDWATKGQKIKDDGVDKITDTVGAIAIDQFGRIAAGSSSGGIGMKHRGRIGPAALVGIGTAVIPADVQDQDGMAVAAVTSGTGEHMATTMASQKCAERIFQGTRRGPGGKDMPEDDESAILQGFIVNDFQEHPGVKNSSSAGAIGVMAVKKSSSGYYLYFAHNTESFALASMGSNDREPLCVMSRVVEGSSVIAQGARKIRL
ncbi:N-terminal nucleophile aminohydrolase [Annulohypoxylon maeteangense]|uniref:N-terminal nucleophile aminohydrolase n=1 Tax=Annulohypoxylon maeteangense TaxID=1927788 RepID=UPI0020088371|nr:N-terminal nucleophile aminohydrolase [Annulohypoxylon maeteangense]KAI0879973.1 N-terminal nucleophile aminohydrolase [Annulohypoxylon maeteangense]